MLDRSVLSSQNFGSEIYHGSNLIFICRHGDYFASVFIPVTDNLVYHIFISICILLYRSGFFKSFNKEFGRTVHDWRFRSIQFYIYIIDFQTHAGRQNMFRGLNVYAVFIQTGTSLGIHHVSYICFNFRHSFKVCSSKNITSIFRGGFKS